MQFAFIVFLFVTVSVYNVPDWLGDRASTRRQLIWPASILMLASLGILLLSQDISGLSGKLFGISRMPTISTSAAISYVMIMDCFFVSLMTLMTGGIYTSVFNPALLSIVPIAIFLRTSGRTIAIATALTVLVALLSRRLYYDDHTKNAATFSMLAFLSLTLLIGWITRPL
jgi:hypothetical protein